MLEDQGKYEEAMQKFEHSARIKPDFALPWMRQAWCFQKQGNNAEAINKAQKALELAPNEAMYWNACANMLNQEKRYDEADRAYSRVTELVGWTDGWQINWAEAKLNRGDVEGGKQLLREVIEKSDVELTRTLARAFISLVEGDYETATKAVFEAAALDPNNGFAVRSAQQACLQKGDYQRAIQLGTSIRFNSENAEQKQMILNLTSMGFNLSGQQDSAIVYAQRAILADSTVGFPYATLAEAYAMKGQNELFFFYLEKAFQKGMKASAINGQEEPYGRFAQNRRYRKLLEKYKK